MSKYLYAQHDFKRGFYTTFGVLTGAFVFMFLIIGGFTVGIWLAT